MHFEKHDDCYLCSYFVRTYLASVLIVNQYWVVWRRDLVQNSYILQLPEVIEYHTEKVHFLSQQVE